MAAFRQTLQPEGLCCVDPGGGIVVIKASFAGAALNHYTCTNMLRSIGVAVHIILRFGWECPLRILGRY